MAVLKRGDEKVGPVVVASSRPSGAMHERHTRLEPKIAQHLRQRFEPASCKDAKDLAFDAGRIGERADEIEEMVGVPSSARTEAA